MSYGIFVTVTHTGSTSSGILLADIFPTTDGHTAFNRAGPVYVPFSGSIVLTYSDTVALSFESGNIRKFVDAGYLTATLSLGGIGVTFPPASGDVSGSYPALTVVGLQGNSVDNAAPAAGESLVWDAVTSKWTPSLVAASGAAGGDLSGNYPNPTVDGLQTRPVDPTAPAINDSLVWDGAKWTHLAVGAGAAFAVWGHFSDSTDQTFAGGTFTVKYNTTEGSNGVSVVNDPVTLRPTRITVAQAGVYSISISPQLLHTGGGTETITFWAKLDGVTIPRSASSLEMGNNNNRTLPFMELVLSLAAGQYIEWVFTASSGTNLTLEAFPENGSAPAIPSVIVNVKRLGS